MDAMDYVMHHRHEDTSPPQPHQHQLQQQQQQPQQQQQQRQCPYSFDPSPTHYGAGLHNPSQHIHSHYHSPHNPQSSQNPGLAPPTAHRNQASHPYDPVYSSISTANSNFYSQAPSYQWLPHPRASMDSFYSVPSYPNTSSTAAAGSAGTPGNNSSNRAVGGLDSSSASGPVQPAVQNQQTPRHEPFTPFPAAFHHQSAFPHRFGALPAQMPAPTPNNTQQSGQQSGRQAVSFTLLSEPPTMSDRLGTDFGLSLPALNSPVLPRPNSSQTAQQQTSQDGPSGSNANRTVPSSDDSNPASPRSLPGRPPLLSSTGSMLSGLPELPSSRALFDGLPRRNDTREGDVNMAEADSASGLATPPVPATTDRRRVVTMRRQPPPRRSDSSDDYSEDEVADADEHQAFQIFAQLTGRADQDMTEARIRAHQLLRGQLSNKRIASKGALASLQSVDISSLADNEKMCIICYNDFGVENPEGINEAPLRLPRCKHVFGDHCIKKWFEESDSCPYCRDKVPSEPQFRVGGSAMREYFHRNSNGVPRSYRAVQMLANETNNSGSGLVLGTGDVSRYVRAPAAGVVVDVSPSRAWQTGERRSPPSEATENRRRTRARHGSFRGSAATASGQAASNRPVSYAGANPSAAQHQQSPGRERVNPPTSNLPPQYPQYSHDPRLSLTPLMARQFSTGNNRPQTHYNPYQGGSIDNIWQPSYQRAAGLPTSMMAEPLGLNPPTASMPQPFQNYMPPPVFGAPSLSNQGNQEQVPSNAPQQGVSGAPSAEYQPFPGPASMAGFASSFTPSGVHGYLTQDNTQNNQGNSNGVGGFGFSNTPSDNQNNQGTAFPQ